MYLKWNTHAFRLNKKKKTQVPGEYDTNQNWAFTAEFTVVGW